tara:strand:+ start:12582 stop:14555 length:1974 start_codon:yes stop_codon:yes gene_type:complete
MADRRKRQLTIFQKLNNVFGREGLNQHVKRANKYSMGSTEIIKTQSKEEFETVKLQAQQQKYLSNAWSKVDGELYQQAIHYETTRVGSYSDFETMDFYPEIAAALDIFMEESTTPNDNGKIINVYSDSKRVKRILEDLFINRLDIHTSLPMWTRNTCKYGDNFVQLNINDNYGVIGARQLPNFEIERRENDIHGIISPAQLADVNKDESRNKTTFFWKGRDLTFNSWQIAHFRLLGDDRKLPYGTSFLEKARRIWKQLILSEDAMLVYRVTRAPERRVYKIFVGNIDNEDVPAYVDEIANRFKRAPLVDPQTGQMDLRYNQLGYDQDIFIPVRDENAQTPIDTLQGAQNLDQIADIEYLQRKLVTALRVPKTFLNFDEPTGEGKNLALQDIRFSRTINRIQQAMLHELNKIAIIHLYLLGFTDDLDNFTITLNNPSTQAEMLKIEHTAAKISLYKDAVGDAGNGFGAMSMTKAKRDILGWSDDEIKQDLLEQRMEKAAAFELENTHNVIKNTGIFDRVDKIYGDMDAAREGGQIEEDGEGGPDGGSGGGGGGGGFAGGFDDADLDLGDEDGDVDGGFDEADLDLADEGDDAGADTTDERHKHLGNIISEDNFNRLANSLVTERKKEIKRVKITDKGLLINDKLNEMVNEINENLGDK